MADTPFYNDTPKSPFYETEGQAGPTGKLPSRFLEQSLGQTYGAALDRDPSEVVTIMSEGMGDLLDMEAQDKIEATRTEIAVGVLSSRPENLGEALISMGGILGLGELEAPDLELLFSSSKDFSPSDQKTLGRIVAANRIVADRRAEYTSGFWSGLGHLTDMMVSSPVHNVLSITPLDGDLLEGGVDLVRLAQEANALVYSDIPKDVFEKEFGAIVDRVNDAGLFTEDNQLYLEAWLQMVNEGGKGFNSKLEEGFQGLDLLTLGTSAFARSILRGVAATPEVIARASSVRKATQGIIREFEKGLDSVIVAENTTARAVTPGSNDYLVGPNLPARREIESTSSVLETIKRAGWGEYLDPVILEAQTSKWIAQVKDLSQSWKGRAVDYSIERGDLNNYIGVAYLGKRGGDTYKVEEAAQKFADAIGGKVIPVPSEGELRYVVAKEYNLSTEGLADATDVKDLAGSWYSGILSTTARTARTLDALIKRSEGQLNLQLRNLREDYRAVKKPLSRTELRNVDNVMTLLRDDEKYSVIRDAPSLDEFSVIYRGATGVEPPKRVLDYYTKLLEINDADYFLSADPLFKEAVNNGEVMVRVDDQWLRSKPLKVSELEDDPLVYIKETDKVVPASHLGDDALVYAIKDGKYDFVHFARGNETTRRLYHTDVLGYNIGGHRIYKDRLGHFIKQEVKENTTPITFMGVRTVDEAVSAVDQINTIRRAITEGTSGPELKEIILRNNDFNLAIEDEASFRAMFDEYGLDIGKDVTRAADNEPVVSSFSAGNHGDVFYGSWNSSKKRGDKPIIGYGGTELELESPLAAMERGAAMSMSRFADSVYNFRAINGWLKAAKADGAIMNLEEISKMRPKQAMLAAKLSNSSKAKAALETERETIAFKLSLVNKDVVRRESFLSAAADFVYKKDKKKLASALDWADKKDPVGFIRSIAFNSKLGLGAIDQVYVQASALVNSAAITSGTIGARGAMGGILSVGPMRLALIEQIPEAALMRIAKLQAPVTGLSAEEFIQLRDWIKHTGRNIVSKTVVEENRSVASLASNATSKALDYGQVFFNEGELIARLGAAAMALLERKKIYGNIGDIFEDSVTNGLIHRQDILSQSMTSASSARWQKGVLGLPLQFTTYHIRLMEQIFTDRILTPSERWRLGLTHIMFYGAAGIPAGGAIMERMGWNGTLDPNNEFYDVVRYGALDTLIELVTGVETSLSSRLAAGEGLYDFITAKGEETILETAVGPGGTITWDFGVALTSMVKNLNGNVNLLEADWNRFARNITGYDRAYRAYIGSKYGLLLSRKDNEPLMENMTTPEVVMASLGFSLEEVDVMWSSIGNMQRDDKQFDKQIKEVTRLLNLAEQELIKGNMDGYLEFSTQIGMNIALMTPAESQKAIQRLRQAGSSLAEAIITQTLKRGKVDFSEYQKGLVNDG